MATNREKLSNLEKSGDYLFHGSGYKVDILQPHQAYNFTQDERKVPDDKPGVHATPNTDIAIFMAIFSEPNMPTGFHTSFGNIGDTIKFSASQHALDQLHAGTTGYVYVVDKKEFTRRSAFEYIAFQSIRPTIIIEVTEEDLPEDIGLIG